MVEFGVVFMFHGIKHFNVFPMRHFPVENSLACSNADNSKTLNLPNLFTMSINLK